MVTSARDLADDNWPEILQAAGIGQAFLSGEHGPCPICGGSDRFRFENKAGRGTFFCNNPDCGKDGKRAGDGWVLLMRWMGAGYADAAKFVESLYGGVVQQIPRQVRDRSAEEAAWQAKEKEKQRKHRAAQITAWKQSKAVTKGDPVWLYLVETRKLPLQTIPPVIRYHPGMDYYVGKGDNRKFIGRFPVMLMKVEKGNRAVGVHRTFLTPDGQKAPVPDDPKRLMPGKGVAGGAVRLMSCGSHLGVAEGLETAFAAHLLSGNPVWACISSTIMESFEPPEGVTTVIIYADHDSQNRDGVKPGHYAAEKLAAKLREKGITVRIVYPITPDTDFHDIWVQRLATEASRKKARDASKKAA